MAMHNNNNFLDLLIPFVGGGSVFVCCAGTLILAGLWLKKKYCSRNDIAPDNSSNVQTIGDDQQINPQILQSQKSWCNALPKDLKY